MSKPIERVEAAYLEYEFIPPLELPETWGPSWDRQIEAVAAWQAALDTDRLEGPIGGSRPAPTMRTLARMNTLLESVRERVAQIQSEAANVAIAEMGRRQLPATGEGAQDAFTPLHGENAQRFESLARTAFDVATMAQTEIARLVGLLGVPAAPVAERRHGSALIDFPDRRKAA